MKNKFILIILFLLISLAQFLFLSKHNVSSELIGNFVTFLSIIFGFYITSLTIFATSPFVASLYKKKNPKNKSQNLLLELISNYKFGLIVILISILYLLILQFILAQNEDQTNIPLNNLFTSPLMAIFGFNFWYSYKMLKDIIYVIIQQAKSNVEE